MFWGPAKISNNENRIKLIFFVFIEDNQFTIRLKCLDYCVDDCLGLRSSCLTNWAQCYKRRSLFHAKHL